MDPRTAHSLLLRRVVSQGNHGKPATPKETMIIAICFGVSIILILLSVFYYYGCLHCSRNRKVSSTSEVKSQFPLNARAAADVINGKNLSKPRTTEYTKLEEKDVDMEKGKTGAGGGGGSILAVGAILTGIASFLS